MRERKIDGLRQLFFHHSYDKKNETPKVDKEDESDDFKNIFEQELRRRQEHSDGVQ